jgi:predicted transcriptional regulator
MSLRKIALILGISPTYLSLLLNGKRPWRGNLRERYLELVNTFVNNTTRLQREKETATDTMVGGSGLEPLTSAMSRQHSNQLS